MSAALIGGFQVEPLGRMDWDDVRNALAEATCIWQDLDGLHCDPVPESVPLASHLWAWSRSHSWRFRLDVGTCVGAVLTVDDGVVSRADAVLPRSTPDSGLSGLLAEVVGDVRIVVVGERSQVVFLIGSDGH